MLDKRGNSNQDERKRLLNRHIRLFGLDTIECIIADREFIGHQCRATFRFERIYGGIGFQSPSEFLQSKGWI